MREAFRHEGVGERYTNTDRVRTAQQQRAERLSDYTGGNRGMVMIL